MVVRREKVSFGGIVVDTMRWPIVVTTLPNDPVRDEDLAGMLRKIEELLGTGEKSFQVTDLSNVGHMAPASQRKYAADWTARTAEKQRRWSVGGCLVIRSALVRGLVTAVHWLKEPPQPTTTVATLEEALEVARNAIVEANRRAG